MNSIRDLLLIQSFDLDQLIENYRLFFLGLLPGVFMLAIIIEYFDRLEPFTLVKRAFIAIIILTSVTTFYKKSVDLSLDTANDVLTSTKQSNILLMDMFSSINHWDGLKSKDHNFYKDATILSGTLKFLKHHLFDSFINDGFTVVIYFITKLCFLILKVVYSLVYFLGYGLVGIPCLIYLFPSMGNVLRGAILSFLWLLTLPHVLVFILSMIGSEINKGYVAGQIIGGSMVGTALLFILSLFVAFTPLITAMILNGSGISQAGGIIATLGANYVMSLPRTVMNSGARIVSGGSVGPKTAVAGKVLSLSVNGLNRVSRRLSNRGNINASKPQGPSGLPEGEATKQNSQQTYSMSGVRSTSKQSTSNLSPSRCTVRRDTTSSTVSATQALMSSRRENGKIREFDRYAQGNKETHRSDSSIRNTRSDRSSRRRDDVRNRSRQSRIRKSRDLS